MVEAFGVLPSKMPIFHAGITPEKEKGGGKTLCRC